MNEFFKFPSTPHLAVLSNINVRDEKVMSDYEREEFLKQSIIIEEKIDGANLGISFDHSGSLLLQNRGSLLNLPEHGQWKLLEQWLNGKLNSLFDILSDKYILFGEWCYAQHSVFYDSLPDWFLAFDLYDKKSHRFLSVQSRNNVLEKIEIYRVPFISEGHFDFADLQNYCTSSAFSNKSAEGIYLRLDSKDYLEKRAKLVNPTFIQSMNEHWSNKLLKCNKLKNTSDKIIYHVEK